MKARCSVSIFFVPYIINEVRWEYVGVVEMDEKNFMMLLSIFKVLEKWNGKDPNVADEILDIIDELDPQLSPEQKSAVLIEFLHLKKRREDIQRRLEEEVYRQHLDSFMRTSDYF